jgi:hypothetical protein
VIAGFGKEDVEIEVKENTLSICGEKKEADTERTFLHRGIASRVFDRRFQLADGRERSNLIASSGSDGWACLPITARRVNSRSPDRPAPTNYMGCVHILFKSWADLIFSGRCFRRRPGQRF